MRAAHYLTLIPYPDPDFCAILNPESESSLSYVYTSQIKRCLLLDISYYITDSYAKHYKRESLSICIIHCLCREQTALKSAYRKRLSAFIRSKNSIPSTNLWSSMGTMDQSRRPFHYPMVVSTPCATPMIGWATEFTPPP